MKWEMKRKSEWWKTTNEQRKKKIIYIYTSKQTTWSDLVFHFRLFLFIFCLQNRAYLIRLAVCVWLIFSHPYERGCTKIHGSNRKQKEKLPILVLMTYPCRRRYNVLRIYMKYDTYYCIWNAENVNVVYDTEYVIYGTRSNWNTYVW